MIALLAIPDLGPIAWALLATAVASNALLIYAGSRYTERVRRPGWERRARLDAERENRRLRERVRDERLRAQDAARFAERELERVRGGRA